MLCPKCKLISFDHLQVCGKCHNDLTAVGQSLRGTSANIQGHMFLGSVVGSVVPESVGISDLVTDASFGDGGGVMFDVDEEPPALEFDESEIPFIDTPGSEVDSDEIVFVIPEEQPLVEEVSSLLGSDSDESVEDGLEGIPFQEEEAVGSSDIATMEIDEADLVLDTVVEEPQPAVVESPVKDNFQGQMTLDLDEIDLSDLTNSPDEELSGVQEGVQDKDYEGIVFDDVMDLSLLVGEGANEESDESDEDSKFSDLSPIDLTLMDDALVEMTVGQGSDKKPNEGSEADDDLQLSMDEVDK
ncbi:MAG: hypothetical protein KKD63_07615 [Proteobacteria bacterium]|nr:hypothetical protein [Desulfobulbaceae bacterium]MBU4152731.1 hypothetical protein [Pseudomonadota bacterium]